MRGASTRRCAGVAHAPRTCVRTRKGWTSSSSPPPSFPPPPYRALYGALYGFIWGPPGTPKGRSEMHGALRVAKLRPGTIPGAKPNSGHGTLGYGRRSGGPPYMGCSYACCSVHRLITISHPYSTPPRDALDPLRVVLSTVKNRSEVNVQAARVTKDP